MAAHFPSMFAYCQSFIDRFSNSFTKSNRKDQDAVLNMPRQPKNLSQGFRSRFLGFLHEAKIAFLKNSYYLPFLCILSVLILLQYFYNTQECDSSFSIWKIFQANKEKATNFTVNGIYHYHQRILSYDRFMAMNYRFTNLGLAELPHYDDYTPICRLNMSTLGPVKVYKTWEELERNAPILPTTSSGGFSAPSHCRSRHKVAILVPYRDRQPNLAIFLQHIHPLLQKQLLQYRIFVIEQYGTGKFNKGALYNIAYLETQRFGTWHCLVFHDVDLIPQDERILYSCPRNPTHMSAAVESMNYKLTYPELFGGVTAMTTQQFLKVNGYSNYYWNWGAEDDDMFIRLQASRLPVLRYNETIARYSTLPHKRNAINKNRWGRLNWAKHRFRYEGLKSIEYKLLKIVKRKLFTHILVDVNPFNYEVV